MKTRSDPESSLLKPLSWNGISNATDKKKLGEDPSDLLQSMKFDEHGVECRVGNDLGFQTGSWNKPLAIDSSFDPTLLQYSVISRSEDGINENKKNSTELFDAALEPAFASDLFPKFPMSPNDGHFQRVKLFVQEQLSISFDDLSEDPSCQITGAIYVREVETAHFILQ